MAITLDELKGRLFINKHKLDDELEVQSQIQFQISEELASTNRERERLEDEMEKSDAKMLLKMRNSDIKKTVSELQAEILVSMDHHVCLSQLHIARHHAALWQGMQEAWKQRGFALKALADLAVANYYSPDTMYKSNRKAVAESKEDGSLIRRRRL